MKNRLQIKYYMPAKFPFTRDEALAHIDMLFGDGKGAAYSLPAEPIALFYGESIETSSVILAIGRGGDGVNNGNNKPYYLIDFTKLSEDLAALTDKVEGINLIVEQLQEDVAKLREDVDANTEQIRLIWGKIGYKTDGPGKDTIYGYINDKVGMIMGGEPLKGLENIVKLGTAITNNATRINEIYNDIAAEIARATKREGELQASIEREAKNRETNDIQLHQEIKRVEDALVTEVSRATAAETALDNKIHEEHDRAFKAEGDLNKRIDDETARATAAEDKLTKDLATEVKRASDEETRLSNKIDEAVARLDNVDAALNTKIETTKKDLQTEKEAREAADNVLQTKITENKTAIETEATARETADEALKVKINNDIQTEAAARQNADDILNTKIDTGLQSEAATRLAADEALTAKINTDIAAEKTARENADVALDNKIAANATAIAQNKVKSEKKTITVTGPTENGTNLDVNVDNKTIVVNESGTLSVASSALVQYKGENAISVSDVNGGAKTISLNVAATDNVLTNDENGLYTTLSLKWVHTTDGSAKDEIQLIGKNDVILSRVDVADFIKDGMLDTVKLENNANGEPILVLTFNSSAGKETISVNVKDLVDIYLAGSGIELNNNVIAVKIDANSENYLTVSADGVKISGINVAINAAKEEAFAKIDNLSTTTNTAFDTVNGKITDEANARTEADNAVRAEFAAADVAIREAFAAADSMLATEFTTADAALREAFTVADNSIITEFKNADAALRKEFNDADTLLRSDFASADNTVRSEFTAADTLIKEQLANEKTRAELAEQTIDAKTAANERAINILNGDATVEGSVKDVVFDASLGAVVNTVTVDDAIEQSLVKKFTLEGQPYFYASNDTKDMKHNGRALNMVIDEFAENFVDVSKDIEDLQNRVTAVQTQADNNTAEIAINKENIQKNVDAIAALDVRVTTNETNINDNAIAIDVLADRVTTNETNISNNTTEIENLKTALNELETNLGGQLTEAVNQLQVTINELLLKVANLETELATLKAQAVTEVVGTDNEIKVTRENGKVTVGFSDDAYFIAGN